MSEEKPHPKEIRTLEVWTNGESFLFDEENWDWVINEEKKFLIVVSKSRDKIFKAVGSWTCLEKTFKLAR